MNTGIILAAGKGSRMKAGINKQYLNLNGRPLLSYSLEVFFTCIGIDEIILVISRSDNEIFYDKILNDFHMNKPLKVVFGGDERQESVRKGLKEADKNTDIIIIHDGARPFITTEMIETCIKEASKYGASSLGVPVKETIKITDNENFVINTPDREKLWITQTPQAFKHNLIVQAHKHAHEQGKKATDDAMLVEYLNHSVKMVVGDYCNIKITTAEDLVIAEAMMASFMRNKRL
ncbi:MAG: 2-C-methyl-D-erythritol 4-phosphate cytidylyltransferase [Firmicutes bacterium]|nr:2-C-methyl-D-erythritol 4-phosphate cytidylyltransferase [Bacillota bacterium]